MRLLCENACKNGGLQLHDLLTTILERADCDPPLFYADEVDRWPPECLKQWLDCGFLRTTTPATALPCCGCGGEHVEEIVFLDDARGRRAYLPCPERGPIQIDMNQLRRWEVDLEGVTQMISTELDCRGSITELVQKRFWQVGSACLGGRRRDVFFGRMLHYDDGREMLTRWRVPASGIVFVPSQVPNRNAAEKSPMIVSLTTAILLKDGSLHLDKAYVESHLAGREVPASEKTILPKRAERTAMIAALTKELIEHIRAAYAYACVTKEQTG
jgi:hypothetical protein